MVRLPENIGVAFVVAEPGPDEAEIGEAVEVLEAEEVDRGRRTFGTVDGLGLEKVHCCALRATGNGPGKVQKRRSTAAAGQDKAVGRSESGGSGFDQCLEAAHLLVAEARDVLLPRSADGGGKVGAEVEQVVLDDHQLPLDIVRHPFGSNHSEQAVELIDGSVGTDTRAGLGHTGTVGKACHPLVAAAGGDSVKFDHGLDSFLKTSSMLVEIQIPPSYSRKYHILVEFKRFASAVSPDVKGVIGYALKKLYPL
jgi:hypothetical protein